MRISDWSTDVCSSDVWLVVRSISLTRAASSTDSPSASVRRRAVAASENGLSSSMPGSLASASSRSEEHTSELQSLMRISYAVFCLKKNKYEPNKIHTQNIIKHRQIT